MVKIFERVKKIFLEILPAFLFFFVMFHIMAATRAFILRQHGIVVAGSAIATLGALIVAKVVLIADRIPLLNLYPRKPLMYNVILKTFVFSLVTLLFIVLEEAFSAGAGTGGFSSALRKMSEDISWEAFWLREIWLFVLIAFYCAASELVRVVGWEKVREILFGRAK